jgi:multicomponent K+:H+ antiporter subunit D
VSHWIIAPVILPAMAAPFLVLVARSDLALQRVLSIAATALLLAIALGLAVVAADGTPRPYFVGAWPPPFGIVLVLDRLSALMLVLTAVLALAVVVHAGRGLDGAGRHFHPLLQFQLMGVNGAFLTGDLFNLFVFFEVLLISSYGLMLHGGGAARFTNGIKYITINLMNSTLFLFAVGMIYAVTGTLNMADLALKVPLVPEGDRAILAVGGTLLLVVFATKAALVPLQFWLPGTYAAAPAAVAALFAIMTKVGGYAIVRVYTLIFGGQGGDSAWLAAPWLVPVALVTLIVGTLGLLASRDLRSLAAWSILASMGLLLTAAGLLRAEAIAAALFYLVHTTLAAAALFLLADLVALRRGDLADRLLPGPGFANAGILGGGFLLAAIAAAGMPPLSGFLGKLVILDAVLVDPRWPVIWTVVLGTSLLAMLAFARAGSTLFWKRTGAAAAPAASSGPSLAPAATLLGLLALLVILARPVTTTLDDVARQLVDGGDYVRAVLEAERAGLRPGP